ncbi:MAG: phage tail spike protein, partial [Carnobacterium sp.]|uniref:phage tail spike protein n=1 Tax=Carnobacterium sp. TaxID=48221 RepID=UPI003C723A7E
MEFYILNKNEEITATLSTDSKGKHTPIYSAIVDEKLKSYDILELSIPANIENKQDIKEEYSIVFKDVKGWREYILSEIVDEDDGDITRTIQAELSSVELLDEIIQNNLAKSSTDATILLTSMLKGTRWTVGQVDPSIYNQSFSEDTTMLSVLESIDLLANSFSAEVSFNYVVAGNKITKRQVNLIKQVGADNGKRFEVDKDVISISRTIDSTALKTAIIPFGKEPEEGKKRLDITNLVWSKSKGDPADKPKGQTWIGNPDALVKWGKLNENGSRRHRFIAQEIDVETEAQLASMAWLQLGRYVNPKCTYEVKALDLYTLTGDEDLRHEYAQLGDRIIVTDYYFAEPLVVEARVIELKRDLIDPLNNDLVFGDSKQAFSAGAVTDSIQEVKKQIAEKIESVRVSADGKTNTYTGSQTPANPNEGDMWYRPHPNLPNEEQYLVFNGLTWDIILDTSELNNVAKEVDAVIAEMVIEKERIEGVLIKADQAIADAGFAGINATEAKANASTALEKANTAKTNADKAIADVGVMSPKVTKAVADADSAVVSANTAKTNAETALTTAQTGLTNSVTALDKAGQALTKATATETATGSLTTSHDALTKTVGLKADKTELDKVNGTVTQHGLDITANATAIGVKADKSVVDTINQTVATHSLSIKATADSLASKAEKTLVDSLSGTVATHSTTLTQTAKDIALKADSKEVNTIKGTVDTHSTAISANASGLLVKAEKSEVNNLTGKVTSNTTQIGVNAQAINARLTSTQVDSLVSAKNYVNETQLNATADRIKLEVSSIETELNEEIGEVSLRDKTEVLQGTEIYTDKSDDAVVHVDVDGVSVGGGSGKNLISNCPTGNLTVTSSAIETWKYETLTFDKMTSGKVYTFSADVEILSGNPLKVSLSARLKDGTDSNSSFSTATIVNKKITSTITSVGTEEKLFIYAGEASTTSGNSLIFSNIQLEEGTVATAYEPPAPTPDYPIPIESLNNFDIVSSVGGRNLLLGTKLWNSGIFVKNEGVVDGEILTIPSTRYVDLMYIPLKKGEEVVISADVMYGSISKPNTTWALAQFYKNGTRAYYAWQTKSATTTSGEWERVVNRIVMPFDCDFSLGLRTDNNTGDEIKFRRTKLEVNSIATPYSQAPEDILPDTKSDTLYKTNITLPEPLRSVGDVKDRLFRDNDGLWKIERNVGEVTISKSMNGIWNKSISRNPEYAYFFNTQSMFGMGDKRRTHSGNSPLTFSNFKTLPKQTYQNVAEEGAVTWSDDTPFIFVVKLSRFGTLVDANINKWIKENPINAQYALDVPTTETLSQEFQTKLNNIQSFKGSNYVYTLHDKSGILPPNLNATFKSSAWYRDYVLGDSLDSLNSKVVENSSAITIASDKIESKVSKTEFSILEGKQSATQSQVTQTAQGLLSKAESTVVNAMKGTVDTHSTQIVQTNKDIALKADSSVVNTISGKVTNNSSAISANSTAIGLRLTSVQVEGVLSAKKYINETQLKATSDGLTTNISSTNIELGKSNTRITNVEATANGLQTTVSNKAEQSQVTQIAGQIASKVEGSVYNTKMTQLDSSINLRLTTGQVNESILADKQIKDTRTTNQLPNWYYANYPKQTVEEFKQRATMGVTGTAVYGQLTTQVQWDSSTGGSMTQIFNSSDGVFQRKSNINNTWTAWEQTAEVSKIVAQINLSPKGVLIQGKNIQLDGDVVMDNAFVNRIKAIEVIADKITTGTLNGANVNLINLNASSITAGTFTGANYRLDLNTGTQEFRHPTNGNTLIMNQAIIGF